MGKSSFINTLARLFPSKDNKEIEGGSETVPLLQGTPSAPPLLQGESTPSATPLRTVYRQKPSAPPQTIVQYDQQKRSAPPQTIVQPSAPPLPTPNGSLIGNQTGNLKQKQKQMQRKQDQSTTPVKQQSSDSD